MGKEKMELYYMTQIAAVVISSRTHTSPYIPFEVENQTLAGISHAFFLTMLSQKLSNEVMVRVWTH